LRHHDQKGHILSGVLVMKSVCALLIPAIAILAAGCRKPTEAGPQETALRDGTRVRVVTQSEKTSSVVLADQDTADRIANAAYEYLEGPNARLRGIEFVKIAKPIKSMRNGQEAEYVYVQFHCVNNFNEKAQHQRDLLIVQGGKVVEHFRNREEIENRLGSIWYQNHLPPGWPPIERKPD
jgi:hypothetical protein